MQTKINDKLRILRNMNDLTQEVMAEKIDMSLNNYGDIERGDTKITTEKLEKIIQVFNMDLLEFLLLGEKGRFCLIYDGNFYNSHVQNSYSGDNANFYYSEEKQDLIIKELQTTLQHQKEKINLLQEKIEDLKNSIAQKDEYIELLKKS